MLAVSKSYLYVLFSIILLSSVIILPAKNSAFATVDTWGTQTSNTTEVLRSVSFVSQTHGWAVGQTGVILSTEDGGTTWNSQTSGTGVFLRSVFFTSQTHGWAVGDGGIVLSTTNGGENWIGQTTSISSNLVSVFFDDQTRGWAVGNGGVVLTTTDGGSTWTERTSGTPNNLLSVFFDDQNRGWAVGQNGVVLSTTDGGIAWIDRTSDVTSNILRSVSFANQTHGWAVGNNGVVLSTTNAGEDWTLQTSNTSENLFGLHFVDQNNGWAVGNGGVIIFTTDGGENWTGQASGTSNNLRSVSFVDQNHGWAVGSNGGILRGSDNTAPPAPAITTITQTVNDSSSLTIQGTAEAGSTVTLTNNVNSLTPTATAASDDTWSIDVTLAEGDNTFTATATDVAGNTSGASDPVTITLDTTPPPAPAITTTTVSVSDESFTIEGTAEADSTVTLSNNGNALTPTTITADSNGDWTVTVTLEVGDNTFTATATDVAGNTSGASDHVTITLDTTPPPAPEITTTTVSVSDESFTMEGTAEAGSTVTLTNNVNSSTPTATAASDDTWSIDVTLAEGDNTFTATATDVAGNTSGASDPVTITLDTTPPPAPAITTITQTVNDSSSLTIQGTAEAGSTVTLTNNVNSLTPTATAASDDTWSIDVTLAEGDNEFTATATDATGNTSGASNSIIITLEINLPSPPGPVNTWDSQTSNTTEVLRSVSFVSQTHGWAVGQTGVILSTEDGGTTWNSQTSGTGVFLRSVFFTSQTHGWAVGDGGIVLSTTNGGENWIGQTTGISSNLVSVFFDDQTRGWAVGNGGVVLTTTDGGSTWTERTSGTPNNLLSVFFDDQNRGWAVGQNGVVLSTTDGGIAWIDRTSDVTSNILRSVSFANQTHGWAVGDNGVVLSTTNAGEDWTLQTSNTSENLFGLHFVDQNNGWAVGNGGVIIFTTNAGEDWIQQTSNTSDDLRSVSFVDQNHGWAVGDNGVILRGSTDSTPPPAPVITTLDTTVPDPSFTIEGTAEAGSTITLSNNGSELPDTATADSSDGTWSIDVTLAEGVNVFTATATDVAGNISNASGPVTITLDSVAPIITTTTQTATDESFTITGTAEAGSTITLTNSGNSLTPTTTVASDGTWSIDVTLAEGVNVFTATATDIAGSTSNASGPVTITLDSVTPIITTTTQTATDESFTITGIAEAGSTITLTNNVNSLTQTATVASDRTWSIDVTLDEGVNVFTATAQDATGSTSNASGPVTITLDTTAPNVPSIITTTQTVTSSLFTIEGTAEAGSRITLSNNGNPLTPTTLAGTSDAWSIDVILVDGVNEFTATSQDAAGNTSNASGPVTITLEINLPLPPNPIDTWTLQTSGTSVSLNSVSFVDENNGWAVGDTGTILSTTDGGTSWTDQTSGTSVSLNSVSFFNENRGWAVGSTGTILSTTDGGTSWTDQTSGTSASLNSVSFVDENNGWAVGTNGVILSTTDGGTSWTDQTSGTSEILNSVSFVDENNGWAVGDTGTILSTTDGGTSWTDQTSGTSVSLRSVSFVDENRGWTVGTAGVILSTTDGGTSWTDQTSGTSAFLRSVSFVDQNRGWAVGDTGTILSTTDGGTSWTLQTSGTSAFLRSVSFVDENNGWAVGDNGVILRGSDTIPPSAPVIITTTQTVTDSSLTIQGTAEADSTVTLTNNVNSLMQTATAASDGAWSFGVILENGNNEFTATATDAAGNTSGASGPVTITLDSVAPIITTADTTVTDKSFTITGTAVADRIVTLSNNGNPLTPTVTAASDGTWSIDVILVEGPNEFTATATDAAGNTSGASGPVTITLDSVAPIITTADTTVTDKSFTITGTAVADRIVTLSNNGNPLTPTVTAASDGTWSIDVILVEGPNEFTATATDAAGNTSGASGPVTITLDSVAPIITTADTTVTDESFTITGTAVADRIVTLSNNGNPLTPTVTAASDGAWSIDVILVEGPNEFTATATDAAGNTSGASGPVTITLDTTAPNIPVITTPTQAVNDSSLTIQGTAEAGSTVTLTNNVNSLTSTVTTDSNGDWTVIVTLEDSNNTFTATATDAAGNTSAASGPVTITLDTTVPPAPVITTSTATVSNSSFTIGGTAEAGSTVTLTNNVNSLTSTVTTDSNGDWTVIVTLEDSNNTFTATATDAAGNTSAASGPVTITLDTTVPPAPVITTSTATVSNSSFTIEGTAEAGSTVTLTNNVNSLTPTVTTDSNGDWTVIVTLEDGDNTFTATATDAAGNTSDPSGSLTITFDDVAPVITTPTQAVNDSSLTIEGTAEAGSTITLSNNGNPLTQTTTVASDDTWSIDVILTEGGNEFTATATDATGNISDASGPVTITLDTTVPNIPVIIVPTQTVSDSSFAIRGTAEAGSTITLSNNGNPLTQTTTPSRIDGIWGISVTLTEGDNEFTATATDAAGNTSGASNSVIITFEVNIPLPPSPVDTWTLQPSGTSPDLRSVSFTNQTHGWTVGDDGVVLFTTDGGTSWNSQTSNTIEDLFGLYFLNQNHGWAVGNDGVILSTTDGGTSWNSQTSGTDSVITSVLFFNENRGWVVGTNGVILSTTDGGTSWTPQTSGTDAFLRSVSFVDQNRGWIVGTNGVILSTTDGGTSWTPQTSGTNTFLTSVSFVDQNRGWAVGSNGVILSTTDGGTSWTLQPSGTNTFLTSVSFVDQNNGLIVGAGGITLYTTDGGTSWILQPSGSSASLNSVSFVDQNNGWAVGDGGVILRGSDTISPSAPTITTTTQAVNDSSFTIQGTAEAGSTVTLSNNVNSLMSAITADSNRDWTVTVNLENGPNTFTAIATDATGNTSDASGPVTITLDTTAPNIPVITTIDTTVSDESFTIEGTAEAGSTVTLSNNGNPLTPPATTTADSNRDWTVTVTLEDGNNIFTATATDVAGNISGSSSSLIITLDTTAPQFSSAVLNEGLGTLVINFDETIDQSSVTVSSFAISDGGTNPLDSVSLGGAALANTNSTAITITLTEEQRVFAISYATPQLDITAGAIRDVTQNDIASSTANPITMIDDDIPPQFSSAVLNEGPGMLIINFDETIEPNSVIVSSFAISDGTNPTDTVSLGGATHTSVNSTAITITLTESQRGSAVSYGTPQLDITAGAIQDVTQNDIASSTANPITMIDDSIPPQFSSAVLNEGPGTLVINFNENIDQSSVIVSSFAISDGANPTDTVSLGGAAFTNTNSTAITITLTESQRGSAVSYGTPQLDITAGAIQDVTQNDIASSTANPITMIDDSIPPQFSSAVLNEGPGTLVINFNENIDQSSVIVSSFAISDGANPTDTVSLGGAAFTNTNSTAITITLTEPQRGSAVSYGTPQLDITAGAIQDVTQNDIASSTANPITMIDDDIPPQFSSAVLNEGPGTLVINFNENIDQSSVTVSSFAISDGANPTDTVSLGGAAFTNTNSTAITITLTESQRGSAVSYGTPQLDITAGAIQDVTQNDIASSTANPITMIDDDIPPQFSSAVLNEGPGTLVINFNENIDPNSVTVSSFAISDGANPTDTVSLGGAAFTNTNSTAITITLTEPQRGSAVSYTTPQLDITAGAIQDVTQNGIASSAANPITMIDDSIPPQFSSAVLNEGPGTLVINFNENIDPNSVTVSSFAISDGANPTDTVSLGGAAFTNTNSTAITITLTEPQRGSAVSYTTPQLDITAGAIQDVTQNGIASSAANPITMIDDDIPPQFSSAVLNEGPGTLVINFNENIDQSSVTVSSFAISDGANPTDTVSLGGAAFTNTNSTAITITLTEPQRGSAVSYTTPQLDITAGAIQDVTQNGIASSTANPITMIDDDIPPQFSSAVLNEGPGTLIINFNETIDQSSVIVSSFAISDGANPTDTVSLGGAAFTNTNSTAITITLTESQRGSAVSYGTPQLDITAGAIQDVTQNGIASSTANPITMIDDDIPPQFSSAVLNEGPGTLVINFNENIDQSSVTVSSFAISDGANPTDTVSLGGAAFTNTNSTAITITLTEPQRGSAVSYTTPQLDITAGAIQDVTQNGIASSAANPITMIDDSIPPQFSSAVLNEGPGTLVINFNENIDPNSVTVSSFAISDGANPTDTVSLGGAAFTNTNSTAITITLTEPQRGSAVSYTTPQLDITAGAIQDVTQNGIASSAANQITMIDDSIPPEFSSAVLNEGLGTLVINFNENIDQSSVIVSSFAISDGANPTDTVSLGGTTHTSVNSTAITITLTESQRGSAVSYGTPQLDITAGAIQDVTQNGIASSTANQITMIDDDIPPEFSSAVLNEGLGTLVINFNENIDQSSVIVSSFAISDGANPTDTVSLGGTTHTSVNSTAITITLTESQRGSAISYATPQLDITAGAIQDVAQNGIASSTANPITMIDDDIPPQFSSAVLNEGPGTLIINFNETIDPNSVIVSSFAISDGANPTDTVSLGGAALANTNSTAITITLTEEQRVFAISYATPQLDITAGAIRDVAQNGIASSTANPITMIDDDIPPQFSSAVLNEGPGTLIINFNETIDQSSVIVSSFAISDGANPTDTVSLGGAALANTNSTAITITLTEEQRVFAISYATPQLDITAGAIRDVAQNGIASSTANPITMIDDDIPPQFSSAVLNEGPGTLIINFNETIDQSSVIVSSFTISDGANPTDTVSLGGATHTSVNSTAITITLTESQRGSAVSYTTPQLDITAGAIQDVTQNDIASSTANPITMIDDSILPQFSSAVLNEGLGTLIINFDENIDPNSVIVSSFAISDGTNPTDTVSLGGATHTSVNSTAITITLTESQRGSAVSYGTPQLDITAGAIQDVTQNGIASSTANPITMINDSIPPEFSSAVLNEGPGTLIINFNENIDQSSVTVSSFAISDGANPTDTVSLGGAAFTNTNSTAITITLTESQRGSAISYTTPQLDITAGAIQDVAQNGIASSTANPITMIDDDIPPQFSSAVLNEGPGTLVINFNENIDPNSVTVSSFAISDGANPTDTVSLGGAAFTNTNSTAITITLTEPQRGSAVSYTTPQLDITAGAIQDVTQNGIASSAANPITMIDDDIPPQFSSAVLNEGPGTLVINFNENIDQSSVTVSSFAISDGANPTDTVSLGGAAFTNTNSTAITITLTESQRGSAVSYTTPQLDITAGAIQDVTQNGIASSTANPITMIDDDIPPQFSSAVLNEGPGTLVINFNENIDPNSVIVSSFAISDGANPTDTVSLGGAAFTNTNSTAITITLTESQRGSAVSYTTPQLDITAGAIQDVTQNDIASSTANPITMIDDDIPPQFSSAVLNEGPGTLVINFNENIDPNSVTVSSFAISDGANPTDTVSLGGAAFTNTNSTAITITLTEPQRGSAVSYTTPQLDITAGAIQDVTQNGIASSAANPITMIDDDIPPQFSSAVLNEGPGTLIINFNETIDQSSVIVSSFTISDGANPTDTVSLGGATHTSVNSTAITITLTESQRGSAVSYTTPQLDITAGAIQDVTQNDIASSTANPITMIDDSILPQFSSAVLNEGLGTLIINFDENIDPNSVIVSSFAISDGTNPTDTVSLGGATHTSVNSTAITITLTESQRGSAVSYGTPQLDITAGAIQDVTQNGIASSTANPITMINDSIPPEFSSAVLNEGLGTLVINFNENIDQSSVTVSSFAISDGANPTDTVSLGGAAFTNTNSTAITITLTEPQRGSVVSYTTPQLDITAGAIQDVTQNGIASSTANPITMIDDDIPPQFSSAVLNEGPGTLVINFDENIDPNSVIVSSFAISDGTNPTDTVSLGGATHTSVNSTAITITLTESQRGSAVSYGTPQLDITAGAIQDVTQNGIASSTANPITMINDSIPPEFSSAVLNEGLGTLVINFNENIDQSSVTVSSFAISDGANPTDTVSLGGAAFTNTNSTAITITLTEPQRGSVVSYTTPQLDITAGAIQDVTQNGIASSTANPITMIDDDIPPQFSSAVLNEGPGTLVINFNENIDPNSVIVSSFAISDGANPTDTVSLGGAAFTNTNSTAITITLTESQRGSAVSYTTPQLDITAGAIQDVTQNGIASSTANQITMINDNIPPEFSSAVLNEGPGTLVINFNENIDQSSVIVSSFAISDGANPTDTVSLGGTTHTSVNSTAITITLTESQRGSAVSYTTPQLDITAGAIQDVTQNGIASSAANPITMIDDSIPPQFSSAVLNEGPGTLVINFNENIDQSSVIVSSFAISDGANPTDTVSLGGTTHTSVNSTAITITLTESQRGSAVSYTTPQLDITAGAIQDVTQNGIASSAANLITMINDNIPPQFSSAVLNEGPGTLVINFDENIDPNSVIVSSFAISDGANPTDTVSLGGTTHTSVNSTAITITLTESQRGSAVSYTTPQLDITAGAIQDVTQNGIASSTANQITMINDNIPPEFSSAVLNEGPGTLVINFNENIDQSSVIVSSFAISDGANPTDTVSLGGTTHTSVNSTAITITLTESQRGSAVSYTTPQLDITAGAIQDVTQNGIASSAANLITMINDNIPPQFSSAVLNEGPGTLVINFDENIDQSSVIVSSFAISDGANPTDTVSLGGTTHTSVNSTAITITLTESQRGSAVSYTTPQLDITAGAIQDVTQNGIASSAANQITMINDSIPPQFSSAVLNEGPGTLVINFDENI